MGGEIITSGAFSLPTTLVLVRHGQTLHNLAGRLAGWTDSPLSDVGRRQAEFVAAHIASRFKLTAIYASPLQRARLTARTIGRRTGLEPTYRDDLKELNFGDLENKTESEISASHPGIWAASQVLDDHAFSWPNGEARHLFYDRVERAFAEIAAAHSGQTVAIVSHGGVLGSYLAGVIEGKPYLWLSYLVKNCSTSVVELRVGGAREVTSFNDHSYLPATGGDLISVALATADAASDS